MAWTGEARYGKAGAERIGLSRNGWNRSAMAWSGAARQERGWNGNADKERRSTSRRDGDWLGKAGVASPGEECSGTVCQGKAWHRR